MEKDPSDPEYDLDFNFENAPGWEEYTDESGVKKRRKRNLADVKDGLKKLGEKIGQTVIKTGQKIGHVVEKTTDTIGKTVEKVVEKTTGTIGMAVEKVGDGVKGFVEEKTREKREFDAAVKRELEQMRQNQDQPQKKEQEWQDLTSEAFHKKFVEEHTPLTEEQILIKSMTPKMKEAYSEAELSLESGQDSIAAQYYQIILNETAQGDYPQIKEFIREKLKKIY